MQKLRFSIVINAPKEKVWHTMLDDKTYRQWSEAFAPGSHFVGSWEKGCRIVFLATKENGNSGYAARIAENRRYEFVSIEYLAAVQNGREDTTGDAASWSGAHENYTFIERDGATEVLVELDTIAIDMSELRVLPAEHEVFAQIWPEALQRLKEIAEAPPPTILRVRPLCGNNRRIHAENVFGEVGSSFSNHPPQPEAMPCDTLCVEPQGHDHLGEVHQAC